MIRESDRRQRALDGLIRELEADRDAWREALLE